MYCTTLNRASLLILSILLIATQQAAAQAGQLDPTFGTGGVFVSNFAQGDVPNSDNAIALQSDGKIVLGGSTGNFAALVRLNTNGTLDTSFGSGGIVNNNFGVSDASVFGVAIQPDGKIVAAAAAFGGGGSVGRFNPDGSVDTTFGTGGFAISTALFSQQGTPNAFGLQTDGKILVTGAGLIGRYTNTGQLDTTFGSNGIAALNASNATGIAVQADGKILVTTGSGAPTQLLALPNFPSIQAGAIIRLNANGAIDTTFAISGQAACVSSAAGVAIQSNGKIVVAGNITSAFLTQGNGVDNQTGFGLVRYNPNGSIDTTFNPGNGIGSGGGVITGFGNSFPIGGGFALAIQSNGEIVVAGLAGNGRNGNITSSSFVLARYTTTGHLDTNFGANGTVITTLSQGPISFVSALALQSDGKIVAAGNTAVNGQTGFVDQFAVARFLAQ